jgi:hypothetical protein
MDRSTDDALVQPAKRHKPDRNETDDTVVSTPPQTPGDAHIVNLEVISPRLKNLSNMEKVEGEGRFDNGYDSDGKAGPFYDVTSREGKQIFEEDDEFGIPFVPERAIGDVAAAGVVAAAVEEKEEEVGIHVSIEEEDLKKMKASQLRDELRCRYESTSGTKSELLKRLEISLQEEKPKYSIQYIKNEKKKKATGTKKKGSNGLDRVSKDAYWQELKPKDAVVEEPINESFSISQAPTVPVKHNFDDVFDIPVFAGKANKFVLTQPTRTNTTTRIKLDRENEPITRVVTRDKGFIRPEFITANGLSKDSHPHQFADCFIPLFSKKKEKQDGNE